MMNRFLLLVLFTQGLIAQDKVFFTVTAFHAAATAADGYMTVSKVGRTSACPYETWSPSLYGRYPTPLRTAAVMGGMFAASTLFSYGLKKKRLHIWKIPLWTLPQAYLAAAHTAGAVNNLIVCH